MGVIKIMEVGTLFVISGPSGSGKGTILNSVVNDEDVSLSISATTRNPRNGEKDGVHYHFMTREKFLNEIANNNMLEYNEYCGNLYGTLRSEVESLLAKGKDVILEIDVNGAKQIAKAMECVRIFILPPSMHVLKNRLSLRGTETADALNNRINQAYNEISGAYEYDYIVVNDELEDAVDNIRSILKVERLREDKMKFKIDELKKQGEF